MTLCSGAIVFSMSLLDKFLSPTGFSGRGWLLASWIAFGCALSCIVVSFLFSQQAMRCQRDILESCGGGHDDAPRKNCWTVLTLVVNWCSLGLFLAGMMFLLFAGARLLFSGKG